LKQESFQLTTNESVSVNMKPLSSMSVSMSKFFSVAKIAELLQSPQRRSRVTVQNQEMTVEKETLL